MWCHTRPHIRVRSRFDSSLDGATVASTREGEKDGRKGDIRMEEEKSREGEE